MSVSCRFSLGAECGRLGFLGPPCPVTLPSSLLPVSGARAEGLDPELSVRAPAGAALGVHRLVKGVSLQKGKQRKIQGFSVTRAQGSLGSGCKVAQVQGAPQAQSSLCPSVPRGGGSVTLPGGGQGRPLQ